MGELEAMASLIAEADEAPAQKAPAKKAAPQAPAPEPEPKTAAAIVPTFTAAAQATSMGPVELLLFVLALPVMWPVAAWGLVGGGTRQIATWIWITVSMIFFGAGLAAAALQGVGTPLLFLPSGLAVSVAAGGLLLLRQGEPKPAKAVVVVAVLGGLAPLLLLQPAGGMADELEGGHNGLVQCLAISADGTYLLSGAADREAILWNLASGAPAFRLSAHKKAVSAAALVDAKGLAVTSGWDGLVITWDVKTGEARSQFTAANDRGISAMVATPDGKGLVLGNPGGELLTTPLDKHEPTPLGIHDSAISALALDERGKRLASAASDGTITVWDLGDRSPVFELEEAHLRTIRALAFTDDGQLVSGGNDRTLKVWSAEGQPVQSLKLDSPVRSLAVRGSALVAGLSDRTLLYWDLAEVATTRTYALKLGKAPPTALVFAHSGEAVIVCDDKRIRPIPLSRFSN
jgi:hypothetical protein